SRRRHTRSDRDWSSDVCSSDLNGAPQIKIYPSPQNSPGNFGLLCIGQWTNSEPDYSNWIQNGPTADDIQALVAAGSLPVMFGIRSEERRVGKEGRDRWSACY